MSKKIKAKNKHSRANKRGQVRNLAAEASMTRTELTQGVGDYRNGNANFGKSDFNKSEHKPNAYQARKRKRAKNKPLRSLASLFG